MSYSLREMLVLVLVSVSGFCRNMFVSKSKVICMRGGSIWNEYTGLVSFITTVVHLACLSSPRAIHLTRFRLTHLFLRILVFPPR